MPVLLEDEFLADAGMSEGEARAEIACRLYDAGRLTMSQATRWTRLTRRDFEQALLDRGLPIVRLSDQTLNEDLRTLQQLG